MDLVDDMLVLCLLGDRAKDVLLKSDEKRRVVVAVVYGFNFILQLPSTVGRFVAMLLVADCEARILLLQNIIHLAIHRYCIASIRRRSTTK